MLVWTIRVVALLLVLGTARWWWPLLRSAPDAIRGRRVAPLALGALALGGIGFTAIQWVPYGWAQDNPPVLAEPDWPDAATRELVMRTCGDCHSNETEWPWYTQIAPGSWLITRDVLGGRDAVNFSEWVRGTEAHEDYADEATESVEEVQEGSMPPARYLLLHPEADLSAAEEAALIEGLRATFGDRRRD